MVKKRKNKGKDVSVLRQLQKKGIFTLSEGVKFGLSQPTISRLTQEGVFERLTIGLYKHVDSEINIDDIELVIANHIFGPKSIIGGLTALYYHRLISDAPEQVWVIVPPHRRSNNKLYRCIRSQHDPQIGVLQKKYFKVTNIERTVVESLVYQKKIGIKTALMGAKNSIKSELTTERKLFNIAKLLNVENQFLNMWEYVDEES